MSAKLRGNAASLIPPISLLCKLGSIVVHVEEMTSHSGHAFDAAALGSLLNDPEVKAWMKQMGNAGLLPLKR